MVNISICITIFNELVNDLVTEIHRQATALPIQFEILLADDASKGSFQAENRNVAKQFTEVKYFEQPKNIGRAKIRNVLASKAKGDFILFLDGDVSIHKVDFLANYVAQTNTEQAILLAGGCVYKMDKQSRKGKELRYKYGKFVEEISIDDSGKVTSPFLGCNLFVSAKAFNTIAFDEEILNYGFEDLLFAVQFEHQFGNYELINNPVLITDADLTEDYIAKIIDAMKNLAILYHQGKLLPENEIRLLLVYQELKQKGLVKSFYRIATSFLPLIVMNLSSSNPSIKFFQLFKLIHFIEAVIDLET